MSQITGRTSRLPEPAPKASLARRGVALMVLLVFAFIVLKVIIHVVLAIALGAALVVGVIAAIWAARVLF